MSEKVHFDDFVEQVALESGFDVDTAREYVEDLFGTIVQESSKGRRIKFRGFGSFKPRWYKAKRGINPQTKQPIDILPHYHINFKSSKNLEKVLNSNESLKPIALETPLNRFLDKLLVILLFVLIVWMIKALIISDDNVVVPLDLKKTSQSVVVKEIEVVEEVIVEKDLSVDKETPQKIVTKPIQKTATVGAQQELKTIEEILYPGMYKVTSAQTLSFIGFKVYKSYTYWPLIFTANSSKISDPDKILKDATLYIPNKEKGAKLHDSYLDVYEAYMNADKMRESFGILCKGAKVMGKGFQSFLAKKLHPMEYKIIQRCVNR